MFKFPSNADDCADPAERSDYKGADPSDERHSLVQARNSGLSDALLEAIRQHAATAIACCLDADAEAYVRRHAARCDTDGHPLIVRNGYQPERQLTTSVGPVAVRPPKMRLRADGLRAYRSALVPRYQRHARAVRGDAAGHYLRALIRGQWPQLIAELLGMPESQVLHLPTTRLENGWQREANRLLMRSNLTESWFDARVDAIPPGTGINHLAEGARLVTVVARQRSGHWQLLACQEAQAPLCEVVDKLMQQLFAGGLLLRGTLQISVPPAKRTNCSPGGTIRSANRQRQPVPA
jgi:hypothetical protein